MLTLQLLDPGNVARAPRRGAGAARAQGSHTVKGLGGERHGLVAIYPQS